MSPAVDYIREKARTYDFAQLEKRLHRSLDATGAHLNELRQDQADFKPSAAEWSVGEIIHHVTISMPGMLRISDKLNRKQEFKRPMERSGMGITQHGRSVEALRSDWDTMRKNLVPILAAFTPPLSTEAVFAHVELGPLNSMEWLALTYLHNQRHVSQIERVKSAAGYPM